MSQVISLPNLIGRRYQLGELLGQGGMGAVYRAVDRLTGQTIALKRVISLTEAQPQQSRSDSISFRLALTREFKVLASLRHPNIISVLDYGFDDERQPYITMELLDEAQTVLTIATEQTLQQQIHLLIELLQALAYLHRRDILHRDLKPSNVLVTADGYLKVLDFGLAVESEQAKDMAGTLAYMAPEVMQGQQATSGVDLYAVGVMAYEIFTGRHPFNTDNMQKLVWDVLNSAPDLQSLVDRTTNVSAVDSQQPTALDGNTNAVGDNFKTMIGSIAQNDYKQDERNLDDDTITILPDDIQVENSADLAKTLIPSGTFNIADEYEEASLAAIVGKLLSKSPEVRYSKAYDVIVDLASALNIPVPQESAAVRESFLQAATFVGREEELNRLETALDAATQGQGSAWLIAGESGVGKSRLIEELRIRALSHGVMVLRGQAVSEGGLPYHLWREPVRRLLLTTEMSDLDAGILKEIVPDIGMLLERNIADVIPLEGTAEQQRLLGTIINLFERQNQPVMLILEDLHWSGES
ncbi:MAG: serine/threonine-protein kinase, partial [Candidatus Promineifilaceae bacterium]